MPSFDESIKQVIQTLPAPIRNYIAQEKYTVVARSLMAKYNLHIDQGSVIEREIVLLLMGVENPNDFIQALTSQARLDQKTVDGIVRDVNEQIFMPLRAEMRLAAAPAPAAPAKPTVPQPPRPLSPQQPRPQPAAPRAAEPPRYFHLQNKIPPAPRSVSNPKIAPLPPKAIMPRGGQTSPSPKLLEDHEEPHIEFKKTAPPPPNLPGVIHHAPLPRPIPPPPKPTPPPAPRPAVTPPMPKPTPAVPAVPPTAPAKPYTTDPYREPV